MVRTRHSEDFKREAVKLALSSRQRKSLDLYGLLWAERVELRMISSASIKIV